MGLKDKESGGAGRGIALVLILIELFGAFFFGMTVLENVGSEALRASILSVIGAGLAGIFVYIILHVIPGIRWLMMFVMILLWGFVAYCVGLIVIGEPLDNIQLISHKGPYIAAVLASVFRALMYR